MLKYCLMSIGLGLIPLQAMASENMKCDLVADFSVPEESTRWGVQNDNVMGGKSTGGPSFNAGHLVFSGFTNMDGGGFSSIRATHANAAFAGADAVRRMMKSDGRAYQLAFRTSARDMFRRKYAFRAMIPKTTPGEWAYVTVPLSNMSASIWGQRKEKAFDSAKVTEYGLFIYDGVTGPFSLEIKTMEVCVILSNS